MLLLFSLPRGFQHILNKNPVASRRVIHQHMSHRTNQLPILNDRTAAHPLHDSTKISVY